MDPRTRRLLRLIPIIGFLFFVTTAFNGRHMGPVFLVFLFPLIGIIIALAAHKPSTDSGRGEWRIGSGDSSPGAAARAGLFALGIIVLICGAMMESVFLLVIGAAVFGLAFVGMANRRSNLPDFRPPTPIVQPYQPLPQQQPDQENGLFPTRPWTFDLGNFDVVLLSPGPMQDRVIGWMSAAFGVTREEAAALAAKRLTAIKTGISGADAAQVESALERLGANAEVVRHQARPADQFKQSVQDLASTLREISAKRTGPSPAPQKQPAQRPGAALFDLVLTNPGPNKIATRKALKAQFGLDLLQAYNAVEQIPSVLKQGIAQVEAEKIRGSMRAVGATVECHPSAQPP